MYFYKIYSRHYENIYFVFCVFNQIRLFYCGGDNQNISLNKYDDKNLGWWLPKVNILNIYTYVKQVHFSQSST